MYTNGSDAVYNIWAADASKFLVSVNGGAQCVFAFNAATPMAAVQSDLGGQSNTACPTNANCTEFLVGANLTFSHTNPNLIWELAVSSTAAAIYQDIITNPTAAPTSWVFNRTLVFDFLNGCGSPSPYAPSCLPTVAGGAPVTFVPNWTGIDSVSSDDTSITFALSDDGQTAPQWSTGLQCDNSLGNQGSGIVKYGPVFLVNWTLGSASTVAKGLAVGSNGWRVFNTCEGTITGNWGDTACASGCTETGPTDGTCSGGGCTSETPPQQPVGTSGGNVIADRAWMHEGSQVRDPLYADVGFASGNTGPGSCTYHVTSPNTTDVCTNSSTLWEIATTNFRACSLTNCEGHSIHGSAYKYDGTKYTAHGFHNPLQPNLALFSSNLPVGDHGFYWHGNSTDQQPAGAGEYVECDSTGTPGSAPSSACSPYYTTAPYLEIIMTENSVSNASNPADNYGKHCNGGTTPCQYRFGQTYCTGTNWNFNGQVCIANMDPTGRYVLFVSDWNLTLGCSNGWDGVSTGQLCLDPVSAGNSISTGITKVAADGAGNTTITAVNSFSVGDTASFTGVATATWLNGNSITLTAANGTSFTGTGVTHASYSATDTGTVTDTTASSSTGVTAVAVDGSNNTTIKATNTLSPGMYVQLKGLTLATWLNNQNIFVTGATSSSFTGTGVTHASYASAGDTGTVTWGGCANSLANVACPRTDVFVMDVLSAH